MPKSLAQKKKEDAAWIPKLNLENIHPGDKFYNFRELCNAIDLETSKRKNKSAVLREFHRFVDYSEVYGGYIINRLRTVPLHKKAPSIYQELIQVLVHALLASRQELMIETTYKQLYRDINLASENYTKIYNEGTYEKVRDTVAPISYDTFEEFRRRCGKGLKEKVNSALNYMAKQQLVLWDKNLWICHDVVLEGGIEKGEAKFIHLPATSEERSLYLNARRLILTEVFRCDTIDEIHAQRKSKQYQQTVNNYIHNMYGWSYAYDKLRIWYNYHDMMVSLDDAREALLEEAEMSDVAVKKDILNQKIVDMLNKSAETSHKSALLKLGSGFDRAWGALPPEKKIDEVMVEDTAIAAWKVLTGYFISKDADVSALSAFYPSSEYDKIDDDLDLI